MNHYSGCTSMSLSCSVCWNTMEKNSVPRMRAHGKGRCPWPILKTSAERLQQSQRRQGLQHNMPFAGLPPLAGGQ